MSVTYDRDLRATFAPGFDVVCLAHACTSPIRMLDGAPVTRPLCHLRRFEENCSGRTIG